MQGLPGHDIIVMGASAGGVEALTAAARGLPADLPAAVFVVLHLPADARSELPCILSRAGPLPATAATDGHPIQAGQIYVAPPDYHLLLERGHMRVVRGPKENRVRPALDPLFRSAALAYGPRVVGVVLSGALDDGTAGLLAIKRQGGVAVVQDPKDALFTGMPTSALHYVAVDYCVPLCEIAPLLARLAVMPAQEEGVSPVPEQMEEGMELEAQLDAMDPVALARQERPGTLSGLTCPECKGPLWELRDGKLVRFLCRSGHAFSPESMFSAQSVAEEDALWIALNTLQQGAQVAAQFARGARARNDEQVAADLEARAHDKMRRVELLLRVLATTGDGEAASDATHAAHEGAHDA